MLFVLSSQTWVKKLDFVFIVDIEFEKLYLFCYSCKIIEHFILNVIFKCRHYHDNLNNTVKSPIVLSKLIIVHVHYKLVTN